MEAAGVAAAGITFLHLGHAIYKLARKIIFARRELMELVTEMGIFADLYEDFYKACISEQRKKGRSTSSTRPLIDWIEDAINSFRTLWKRMQAMAGDSRYSKLETLTARVKWLFSENEVKCLRYSLSVARETIRGFSNITVLESINEEIRLINDVIAQGDRRAIQALEDRCGTSLEEKLDELKQMRSVL